MRSIHWRTAIALSVAAAVLAGVAMIGTGRAADEKEKRIAAGETETKKLLLLMDRDRNGKVSKQEFMAFMEAEFDRLDKDKSGELDVQELTHFQFQTRPSGPRR